MDDSETQTRGLWNEAKRFMSAKAGKAVHG